MFMYLFLIISVILFIILLVSKYFSKYRYKDLSNAPVKRTLCFLYTSQTSFSLLVTAILVTFCFFFSLFIVSFACDSLSSEKNKFALMRERAECVALLEALDSDEDGRYKYLDYDFVYTKVMRYNDKVISGKKANKSFWFGNLVDDYYDELELIDLEESLDNMKFDEIVPEEWK